MTLQDSRSPDKKQCVCVYVQAKKKKGKETKCLKITIIHLREHSECEISRDAFNKIHERSLS